MSLSSVFLWNNTSGRSRNSHFWSLRTSDSLLLELVGHALTTFITGSWSSSVRSVGEIVCLFFRLIHLFFFVSICLCIVILYGKIPYPQGIWGQHSFVYLYVCLYICCFVWLLFKIFGQAMCSSYLPLRIKEIHCENANEHDN